MNKKFHNVSLGQGQEVVAESAMEMAASGENQLNVRTPSFGNEIDLIIPSEGHWVILQNIHLVKTWLPSLEKKIEEYSEGSHSDYRFVCLNLIITQFT